MTSEPRSNWSNQRLDTVVSLRRGHDLPKRKRAVCGSVPVIGASGPVGNHNEARIHGPTFTIGRSASIGSLVWVDGPAWPLNTTLYVTDFHGHDPRYLYYLLHTVDFTIYNSGTVQPMLNRNYVAGHMLPIPPLPVQHAIAEVLGSLDDRIAHLQARMRRLAALGDVAFTTIKEKAETTANLGEWIALDKGTSYSKDELADGPGGGRPFINLGNFGRRRLPRWDKLKYYSGTVKARHEAPPGTVVICATDMTSDRAVLGKALMVPDSIPKAAVSLDLFIARQRDDSDYRRLATLLALNHEPYRRRLAEYANGTTVLRVPRDAVERVPMPDLDETAQQAFVAAVEPLWETIDAARLEVATLERTRVTLLPELVTGRLRIPDVDGFLERAGLS